MRKDNNLWEAPSPDPVLKLPSLSIRKVSLDRMTMLSGPYSTMMELVEHQHAFGWPDMVSGDTYALRLRRDRVLVVNGSELSDGWHDAQGVAVSDMSGAYAVFEVRGPEAFALLRRGTEVDQHIPSASVNRAFHGIATMIYAWQVEECYRLHVASPMATAWWTLVQKLCGQMEDGSAL